MSTFNADWFPTQVPPKPSGHYAHIIMLRVTESYPLFQTDGELNTARVSAGAAASVIQQMTSTSTIATYTATDSSNVSACPFSAIVRGRPVLEIGTSRLRLSQSIKSHFAWLTSLRRAAAAFDLHVGHLRASIIGESVKRIYRFRGDEVWGDAHFGDWGFQMGLLIVAVSTGACAFAQTYAQLLLFRSAGGIGSALCRRLAARGDRLVE